MKITREQYSKIQYLQDDTANWTIPPIIFNTKIDFSLDYDLLDNEQKELVDKVL